jgi:hypothetical protein
VLIKTGKRASRKKGYQKENSDTFREKHDFVVNLRMLGLTIVSDVISFRPPVSFVSRIDMANAGDVLCGAVLGVPRQHKGAR